MLLLLGAAEIAAHPVAELSPAVQGADYLLLGEVHDNAAGHALRLSWLDQLQARQPWALAMEQFDIENRNSLEKALQEIRGSGKVVDVAAGARAVAENGGFNFKGWRWSLYEPVLVRVLQQGIPLYPANLSRKSLGAIIRGQQAPPPEPSQWSVAQRAALLKEVQEGHCNLMPESELPLLAAAQRARDLTMAEAMVRARRDTGRPVILLAGNGHVRKDLAVPVWLHQLDPGAKIVSVAVLERGGKPEDRPTTEGFDAVYWVAREERPDPCEALRKRLGKH